MKIIYWVFTFFSIAGLSLLAFQQQKEIKSLKTSLTEMKAKLDAQDTPFEDPVNALVPAESQPTEPLTAVSFENLKYDFGTIVGDKEYFTEIVLTNTGKQPLYIINAKGSCGCTVPTWDKAPIPIQGKGKIKVKFDAVGRFGNQSKEVTISTNTSPKNHVFTFIAKVTNPAENG